MTRFEVMGRIVNHLHNLDDSSLNELLLTLSSDIRDETLEVLTYGKDDTEHLQKSSINDSDLKQAMKDLKNHELLMPEHAP